MDARDVRRLARLAHLRLDASEEAALARDLGRVLDHFDRIREADLDDPGPDPAPFGGALRDDEPRPGLSPEDATRGAPAVRDGRFRVPRFLGGDA